MLAGILPVLRVAIDDVVPHGAGEQKRILKNEADFSGAFFRLIRPDVYAIQ